MSAAERRAPGFLLPLLLAPSISGAAGPPRQLDSGEIQLALRKLGVVGTVLYVAAHPDDENTTLLAYLANQRLLRTAYLSITRGDGGQNLIGSEQGTELGVIRTQELLAARRVDGAEQWFTRARDFGYSKTAEETLRIWDKAETLADVVWVIRRVRPDIVITRFSSQATEGHGHHTASAQLAEEAFRLAGDPAYRPEQLAHVKAWQPRRLLWNRSSWNLKPTDDMSGFLKLDVGIYNPLLGASYGELSADSRSMHKSQGFGAARRREPITEYFKVLDGNAKVAELLGGIDVSWGRFPGSAKLADLLSRAARTLDPANPANVVPLLLEADVALDAVPDAGWREQKRREVRAAIAACAGLWAEVFASEPSIAPGADLKVTVLAVNRSATPLALREVRLPGGVVMPVGKPLGAGSPTSVVQVERTITVAPGTRLSGPYWLDARPAEGLFRVEDPTLIGNADSDPSLIAEFVFTHGARDFTLTRAIAYKWTDPVAGERYRPLEIVPAVSVRPDATVLLFADARPRPLRVLLKAGAAKAAGVLRLELPPGWIAEPASRPFDLSSKGDEADMAFEIRPPAGRAREGGTLRAVAQLTDGTRLTRGVTHIEHPHIPVQMLLSDAQVRLVPVALKTRGTKIGYVPGAGDEVAASLRQVGYDVTMLGDEALATGSLTFDAIVVGVRAYNTSARLPFHHARLMRFVEAGGTLLVQYNTANRISKLAPDIGPYPFEISRDRVTEETAAVTFASPAHRVLTAPNKITAADFEGWVQERGLYFAGKWDPKYQAVLAMNDPGEAPQKGSVIVARHGKGTFVYTGLAFFRQLPAGVPGAYRLFANLIAHGR